MPLKVLFVDDNRDAAESSAELLKLKGCTVEVCFDGPSALEEAKVFGPDVCVIDLALPGMDGVALATQLQQLGRPVRLIALTGSWDITATHRTNNAGFEQHLVKPTDPQKLIEAVMKA